MERFTPQDSALSFLTSRLENGVDVLMVQTLAVHADPST